MDSIFKNLQECRFIRLLIAGGHPPHPPRENSQAYNESSPQQVMP